ncbi:MAG: phosphate/phosphite/phosphonate ABC transporter substrate-binding protein [Polyangiaceae bacterium]
MDSPSSRGSLALGVVTTDDQRRQALKAACEILSLRTHAIVYPQVARSYLELARALEARSIDLAWTPPLIAADLVTRKLIEVAAVSRRNTSAQYRSVIFARTDSGIHRAADLQGKHMAWVDASSASGYVVPYAWLAANGPPPAKLFSQQSFAKTHRAAVHAVLSGTADAGATFAVFAAGSRQGVKAGWAELAPGSGDDLTLVANCGSVPADCISVASRLSPAQRQLVAETFVGLEASDAAVFRAALGAEGYELPPRDYERRLDRLRFEAESVMLLTRG